MEAGVVRHLPFISGPTDPISRYVPTLMTDLLLQHGLSFAGLYDRDGLVRLDQAFVSHLAETDVALHNRLMAARGNPDIIERQTESDLLVDLAPYLEDFIGDLFGIQEEVRALQERHHE